MVDPNEKPYFVKLQLTKDGVGVARLAVHIGSLDEARGPIGTQFITAVRKAVVPEHGQIARTWYLGGFHGSPGCQMADGVKVSHCGAQVLNLGKYKAV